MGKLERDIHDEEDRNGNVEELQLKAAIGLNLLYSSNANGNTIDEERLRRSLEVIANLSADEFASLVAKQKDGEF